MCWKYATGMFSVGKALRGLSETKDEHIAGESRSFLAATHLQYSRSASGPLAWTVEVIKLQASNFMDYLVWTICFGRQQVLVVLGSVLAWIRWEVIFCIGLLPVQLLWRHISIYSTIFQSWWYIFSNLNKLLLGTATSFTQAEVVPGPFWLGQDWLAEWIYMLGRISALGLGFLVEYFF